MLFDDIDGQEGPPDDDTQVVVEDKTGDSLLMASIALSKASTNRFRLIVATDRLPAIFKNCLLFIMSPTKNRVLLVLQGVDRQTEQSSKFPARTSNFRHLYLLLLTRPASHPTFSVGDGVPHD